MRIVQVVQGFPPEDLGGTETYAAQLSYVLLHRGHDVHVFSRSNDTDRSEYAVDVVVRDSLPITRINNTFRRLADFTQSYDNPQITQCFGAFLDRVTPDIVHIHQRILLQCSINSFLYFNIVNIVLLTFFFVHDVELINFFRDLFSVATFGKWCYSPIRYGEYNHVIVFFSG